MVENKENISILHERKLMVKRMKRKILEIGENFKREKLKKFYHFIIIYEASKIMIRKLLHKFNNFLILKII